MIVDEEVSEFLEHHGVKGMRWGQRRKLKKEARFRADQEKANHLIKTSLKDPNVLIKLNGTMVVTGKEFVDHMVAGGLLNVRTTSVYAQQKNKSGPYVLQ